MKLWKFLVVSVLSMTVGIAWGHNYWAEKATPTIEQIKEPLQSVAKDDSAIQLPYTLPSDPNSQYIVHFRYPSPAPKGVVPAIPQEVLRAKVPKTQDCAALRISFYREWFDERSQFLRECRAKGAYTSEIVIEVGTKKVEMSFEEFLSKVGLKEVK